jgi:hypothetical protein
MWLNSHDPKWLNLKRPLTGWFQETTAKRLSSSFAYQNLEWSFVSRSPHAGKQPY